LIGIPNIKLFSYKEFAAIPLMDGNSVRTAKKLRKMIKKALGSNSKGADGYFSKTDTKAPETHLIDLDDEEDPNICYEAMWCKEVSTFPKNCGHWPNSCPCTCPEGAMRYTAISSRFH
jgi:hypothetical protein